MAWPRCRKGAIRRARRPPEPPIPPQAAHQPVILSTPWRRGRHSWRKKRACSLGPPGRPPGAKDPWLPTTPPGRGLRIAQRLVAASSRGVVVCLLAHTSLLAHVLGRTVADVGPTARVKFLSREACPEACRRVFRPKDLRRTSTRGSCATEILRFAPDDGLGGMGLDGRFGSQGVGGSSDQSPLFLGVLGGLGGEGREEASFGA